MMKRQVSPEFERALEAELRRLLKPGRASEGTNFYLTEIQHMGKKLDQLIDDMNNYHKFINNQVRTGGPAVKALEKAYGDWVSGLYIQFNRLSRVMPLAQKADREE